MINSFFINNIDGIHSIEINSDTIPMHTFDPSVPERIITDRRKMQSNGLWPTIPWRDGMELHCEGDIFGSSSADYFAKREAFITALYGDPNVPTVLGNRKLGDLVINFEGATEDWTCPFIVTACSIPLAALSPSRTSWAITFLSWNPYFIGVTTNNKYYYT